MLHEPVRRQLPRLVAGDSRRQRRQLLRVPAEAVDSDRQNHILVSTSLNHGTATCSKLGCTLSSRAVVIRQNRSRSAIVCACSCTFPALVGSNDTLCKMGSLNSQGMGRFVGQPQSKHATCLAYTSLVLFSFYAVLAVRCILQ